MTWKYKALSALIAIATTFVCGFFYARAIYKQEISALKEEYAVKTVQAVSKTLEKDRQKAQKVEQQAMELESALADANRLATARADDIERLQRRLDRYAMPSTSKASRCTDATRAFGPSLAEALGLSEQSRREVERLGIKVEGLQRYINEMRHQALD